MVFNPYNVRHAFLAHAFLLAGLLLGCIGAGLAWGRSTAPAPSQSGIPTPSRLAPPGCHEVVLEPGDCVLFRVTGTQVEVTLLDGGSP